MSLRHQLERLTTSDRVTLVAPSTRPILHQASCTRHQANLLAPDEVQAHQEGWHQTRTQDLVIKGKYQVKKFTPGRPELPGPQFGVIYMTVEQAWFLKNCYQNVPYIILIRFFAAHSCLVNSKLAKEVLIQFNFNLKLAREVSGRREPGVG